MSCFAAVTFADSAADTAQQLPRAMHTPMKDRARITVGVRDGDIIGADNRALQAAVDYVASLGGGIVEIGPGEYLMRDSLHLRSTRHGPRHATEDRPAQGQGASHRR